MQEMPMVTGIGMGEIRTALEIKQNEGLLRKCWWGTWNCADPLEGQTIEPENLFETSNSEAPLPKVAIGSGVAALFIFILSLLFFKRSKQEKPKAMSS